MNLAEHVNFVVSAIFILEDAENAVAVKKDSSVQF